jgi:hypothetical protein
MEKNNSFGSKGLNRDTAASLESQKNFYENIIENLKNEINNLETKL